MLGPRHLPSFFKFWFVWLALLFSQSAIAIEEAVQTFALDGRLYSDAAGTRAMLDSDISLKIQILNPAQDCILYEESQRISTATSDGYFTIRVGAKLGSTKRTTQDPGYAMSRVYSNTGGSYSGKLLTSGAACTYAPVSGEARYLRVQVTPSGDGVTRTLSPPMILDAVPTALVAERAETLQGYAPGSFVKINTASPSDLSQANLENVFSGTNYPKLVSLLSAGSGISSIVAGTGLTGGSISSSGQTIGIDVGTSANKIVQLDSGAKLPAVDGSALNNLNAGSITSGTLSPMRLPASVVLDGGNVTNSPLAIGSMSSQALRFLSGGITRLVLEPEGSVGIGTSSPVPSWANFTPAHSVSLYTTITGGQSRIPAVNVWRDTNSQYGGYVTFLKSREGTPALANDEIGYLNWSFLNSGSSSSFAASLRGQVLNATSGSEKGLVTFQVADGGTLANVFSMNGKNVGIGTTEPISALEIRGSNPVESVTLKDTLTLTDSTANSSVLAGSGSGIRFRGQTNFGNTTIAGIWAETSGTSTDGKLYFTTRGAGTGNLSPRVTIDAFGRVGIGTVTPSSLLQVKSATPALTISDSRDQSWTVGDQLGSLDFTSDDTSSGGTLNKVRARIAAYEDDQWGASQGLSFGTVNIVDGVLRNHVTIDSMGRMKIGLSRYRDQTNLTISSQSVGTPNYPIELEDFYEGNASTQISFSSLDSERTSRLRSATIGSTASGKLSAGQMTGTLDFLTKGQSDSGPVQRMIIDPSGNVGIGTLTPTYRLDVKGTVNTDEIRISGVPLLFSEWATQNGNTVVGSGRVGIGTLSPTKTLTVVDSTNLPANPTTGTYPLHLDASGAYGSPGILFTGSNQGAGYTTAASIEVLSSNVAPTWNLQFKIPNMFSNTLSPAMSIVSGGRVGVGTTSPVSILHIQDGTTTPALTVAGRTGGSNVRTYPTIDFTSGGYYSTYTAAQIQAIAAPAPFDESSSLIFSMSAPGGGSATNRWVMTGDGYLKQSSGSWNGIPVGGIVLDGMTSTGYRIIEVAQQGGTNVSGVPLKIKAGDGNSVGNTAGGDIYVYGGSANGSGVNGDVILAHNGSAPFGRVGVGTAAPETPLHVHSSSAVPFRVTSTNGNGSTVDVGHSGNGTLYVNDGGNSGPIFSFNGNYAGRSLSVYGQVDQGGQYAHFNVDTGGVTRLFVGDSGNVGIGTTAPRGRLTVYGTGQTTANIDTSGDLSNMLIVQGANISSGDGGGVVFGNRTVGGQTDGLFAAIKSILYSGNNNSSGDLAFSTRSVNSDATLTEKMRITASGKVGIGTSAPPRLLSLQGSDANFIMNIVNTLDTGNATGDGGINITTYDGSTNYALRVGYNSGSALAAYIGGSGNFYGRGTATFDGSVYTGTSYRFNGAGDSDGYISSPADGTMQFATDGSPRITIKSTAGVFDGFGIGTTNPTSLLHIAGGTGGSTQFKFDPSSSTSGYITSFTMDNTGLKIGPSSSVRDFQLQTSGSTRFTIDPSGNVGIGTTNPRSSLDINGTISGKSALLNSTSTIDFAAGNIQYTSSNCGAFQLNNLKDGTAYTFVVQGSSASTCSFTAFSGAGTGALTTHMPTDHGATTANKHTIYSFFVAGTHVYFAWMPGM